MTVSTPTLLDRFCRYARIHTEAIEGSPTYPSSAGQWDLAKLLLAELKALGLADASLSEFGIVTATLPATVSHASPVTAWFAHMDTSPETSGKNVKPVIHPNYDGKDIVLPADPTRVIRLADSPELAKCIGKTVITTDGTTLLGADNKAGIAVIMETVQFLLKNPSIPHGPIKICFTCDEEIGHGVDHVDVKQLGAIVGYTLDGFAQGEIEGETFSGDKATVIIRGKNIHPSIAKGRMTNAVRLAGMFIDRLPAGCLSPETSADRDGFLHPYRIEGGVAEVTITFILRDFITAKLADYAGMLRTIAQTLKHEFPAAEIDVQIDQQYRNMADGMKNEPRAVKLAIEATRLAGMDPKPGYIRGGTDGTLLTAKGLPTPNLSTGEHNPHSPLEWTCLEEMEAAVRVLVELAQLWGREKA